MRVHELAKELGLSSKELLDKLHGLRVEAKNHMAALDDKTVTRIKAELKKPKKSVVAAKPVAKPAAPPLKKPEVKTAETPKKTEVKKSEIKIPEAPKKPELKPVPPTPPVVVPAPVPALTPTTVVAERIKLEFPISVGTLAARLNVRVSELIKALMEVGVFANVNQLLGEEVVMKLSAKLGIGVERAAEAEEELPKPLSDKEKKLAKTRPPVVTLMGHVDHGKTSLLDAIRKTNVAGKEAGRITQHIGAYGVDIPGKGHVTFLDTPGHEAFTAMRARGANITDVVVLVVAADDGVMPQTVEAMDHAREAGVPILVAVNKCDLPQANPQKVTLQLQKLNLISEEWGGQTIFCKVSAKTGEGIENLLEMLLLESEILELKANPDMPAQGAVVEGRLTKGSGPVATVIIQKGTLRVGDMVIAGPHYGRVRALQNDRGKRIKEAGPSYAAELHGLSGVPEAGETLQVAEDERSARRIAEKRLLELKAKQRNRHLTLEDLHAKIKEGAVKELKLILKADVQGSVEALAQSLEKISGESVHMHVIHGGVGGPNESDVMLAAASDAIIIGFHVKAESRALQMAEEEGVEIRSYEIIYEAVDDVRKAMEGLLEPVYHEVTEGRAEVRKVFRSSKAGAVGGSMVNKGKIARSGKVRLLRAQKVVFDGKLASLKRFKDDVREVAEGYEFGFVLEGFSDLQEGDILEAYRLEKTTAPKSK